ncbi:hypothetical protein N431DRAFT_30178 [Stipitochalara longipes BDJ]|nr:hypothetical protein N431DRAFT_30178 [Stipitochalara longipes BDJ]
MGFRAISMSRSGGCLQPCSAPPFAATRSLSNVVQQNSRHAKNCIEFWRGGRFRGCTLSVGPLATTLFFLIVTPMTSVAHTPGSFKQSSFSHSHCPLPLPRTQSCQIIQQQQCFCLSEPIPKPSLRLSRKDLPALQPHALFCLC